MAIGQLACHTHGTYLAKEEVLIILTHGFLGCCIDVCKTDMESLCWRDEAGGMPLDSLPL